MVQLGDQSSVTCHSWPTTGRHLTRPSEEMHTGRMREWVCWGDLVTDRTWRSNLVDLPTIVLLFLLQLGGSFDGFCAALRPAWLPIEERLWLNCDRWRGSVSWPWNRWTMWTLLKVRFHASNTHQRWHFGKKTSFLPVIGNCDGVSGALRSKTIHPSRSVENTLIGSLNLALSPSRASGQEMAQDFCERRRGAHAEDVWSV